MSEDKKPEAVKTAAEPKLETEQLGSAQTVVLSDKRKAEISRKAREKVEAELTAKAAKEFEAEELERFRQQAGVGKAQLGGINDELVTITIDLSDTSEGSADPFIHLDQPAGMKYYHGRSYTVPRHVANTLNEIMFRGKLSNLNKDGKSVFRNRAGGFGSVPLEHGARHSGIN